jgi:hypothetical protein
LPRPPRSRRIATVSSSEERIAWNEVLFREVNERIEALAATVGGDGVPTLPVVCECGAMTCTEHIELTREQYEAIRANPSWFVVRPGHEDARVARVVERHDEFVIEAKHGEAAEVAVEHDPRS